MSGWKKKLSQQMGQVSFCNRKKEEEEEQKKFHVIRVENSSH